jgi:hypothetical protein
MTQVDERWLEAAEEDRLAAEARRDWSPWHRVASVFVRGCEYSSSDWKQPFGWVAEEDHFLVADLHLPRSRVPRCLSSQIRELLRRLFSQTPGC